MILWLLLVFQLKFHCVNNLCLCIIRNTNISLKGSIASGACEKTGIDLNLIHAIHRIDKSPSLLSINPISHYQRHLASHVLDEIKQTFMFSLFPFHILTLSVHVMDDKALLTVI